MIEIDSSIKWVAGVDEVGRGPLCGDVVTAAVILDPACPIDGLNDSKKLSEKKRERLFEQIIANAHSYSIARASVSEIDELNIYHATLLAMQRAVKTLSFKPELVLVDGNVAPDFGIPAQAIIKGDGLIPSISAASILAKVTRDREMIALSEQYPDYGYEKHKGYPTKQHLDAIKRYGINQHYRKSFAPVKTVIDSYK